MRLAGYNLPLRERVVDKAGPKRKRAPADRAATPVAPAQGVEEPRPVALMSKSEREQVFASMSWRISP
jgi:hypothetical protein